MISTISTKNSLNLSLQSRISLCYRLINLIRSKTNPKKISPKKKNKMVLKIIAQITKLKPNYYFQWNGPGIIPGTERMVRQKLKTPGTYSFFVSTPNKECFVADTIVINKDTSLIDLNLIDTFVLNCVDTNLRIDVSTISNL